MKPYSHIRKTLSMLALAVSHSASAQSLYLTSDDASTTPNASSAPMIFIEDVSLTYIPEPEVRTYQEHDIITIIIDEVSSQTSSQSLDTKNNSKSSVQINAMLDLLKLFELRLQTGAITNEALFDVDAKRKYIGEGEYEREDKFSARISATVLEVKPNGSLVLQATKRIEKDDEIQTLVIAGLGRTEDITQQNTILSSQLANLALTVENEGDVRKAAKKGFLTEFFDTFFAY